MKRTLISFFMIIFFIFGVVCWDISFMTKYAEGMTERLDKMDQVESIHEKKAAAKELNDFFAEEQFWAHRLIPTGRLEELETLLHKLNAYLSTEDEHEVEATIAEIRARVNLLYSTDVYHWYHPSGFRIE